MMTGSTRGSPSSSASPEGASPNSTRGSSWPVTPTIRAVPFWARMQGSACLRGSPRGETYRQGIIVDTFYHIVRAEGLGLAVEKVDVPGVHQWQLEAQYFADRVLKSESIQYPAENGLGNAKVIDAIYRGAWEQREIRL